MTIGRAADFVGPGVTDSALGEFVFAPALAGMDIADMSRLTLERLAGILTPYADGSAPEEPWAAPASPASSSAATAPRTLISARRPPAPPRRSRRASARPSW